VHCFILHPRNLPHALARKYPNAPLEWAWQYVFAADNLSIDPRSGAYRRHHIDESGMQKAMRAALRRSGIHKPARFSMRMARTPTYPASNASAGRRRALCRAHA
jgi:hypothetical protein